MTRKALVLSGGGPVGIAWESGLIAGLAEAGVDLSEADFILGTSAGSFVGARLAMGAKPAELAAPFLAMGATPSLEGAAPPPPGAATTRPDMGKLMAFMTELSAGKRPAAEIRAEIGAWALSIPTVSEESFIASFGHSLGDLASDAWPDRPYACTAVDARDGAFKLWTAADGVGIARAVASSCSVPGIYPPITINGRRYIDGGMRPGSSVDLARGYQRVVVIAVYQNPSLDDEIAMLRDEGARVALVVPDAAGVEAFGGMLMDSRRRPAAAAAGFVQGRSGAEAAVLREAWH